MFILIVQVCVILVLCFLAECDGGCSHGKPDQACATIHTEYNIREMKVHIPLLAW